MKLQTAAENDIDGLFPGSSTAKVEKKRYLGSLGLQLESVRLGANTSTIYQNDPKLLLFTLSRYKFVSKMFAGFENVLEVGCQEGFGAQIICKEVTAYLGVDFYLPHINSAKERNTAPNAKYETHDILNGSIERDFDGVFALDVLEHIVPEKEDLFLQNICGSLTPHGSVILGMPSFESQKYASKASKAGHVNCKNGENFRNLLKHYFHNCFLFSMNDEVLHTGFSPMSHYLFVLASNKKCDFTES
jgi:2-polyprenyl-3-methyl-5-hydroxy-6-metoxy-1,4-benzoquinol methylase